MTPLINALLGPAAILATVLYARTLWISRQVGDPRASQLGYLLCTFVLAYLAFFRTALNFGMAASHVRDYVFAMGIPVYGVHCYVAIRLAQAALFRGKIRQENIRQRRVIDELRGAE